MTIFEKIELSAQNHRLYLFKEGLSFKIYNENAMWFDTHIKTYRINNVYVKALKQQVFSLKLSQNIRVAKLLQHQNKAFIIFEETPSFICYKISNIIDAPLYIKWCNVIQNRYKTEDSIITQGFKSDAKENEHLPLVFSAKRIRKPGTTKTNLANIEELLLYTIEQQKTIDTLQSRHKNLKTHLLGVETALKMYKNKLKCNS